MVVKLEYNIIKKRNLLMSFTLMSGLLCFAFTFSNTGIKWLRTDYKPVAIILLLVTIILGIFWFKKEKRLKIKSQK